MSYRQTVKVMVELEVDIRESDVDPLNLNCSLGFPGLANHRTSIQIVRRVGSSRENVDHDIVSVKFLGVRKD